MSQNNGYTDPRAPQSVDGSHGPVPHRGFDDEISLADLFNKLIGNKWYVLAGYALVLSLVATYTYLQDPVYEASSLILINNESTTPQLGELMGLQMANKNVANEIEIIKSRTIALRVADALMDWQTVPGTNERLSALNAEPGKPAPTQLDVAQRLMKDYIVVRPVNPDVDLIEIRSKSTVPREAALVADMYADEFYNYNRTQSRRRAAAGVDFLEDQAQRFDSVLTTDVDMVLLVASSGQTHWGALERAREMMNDAGIKPNGVILNRFDAKQAYGGYGYGYGYGAGYGYGYGQEGLYADQEMQQVISQK